MVSSFHYQKQREELNKQLHTVNIIDPVSMFQCELGEVASGIEAEYKKGEHFSSKEEFLDVMEKSYQITTQDRRRFCRSEQRKNMAVAKRWKLCGRDKTG